VTGVVTRAAESSGGDNRQATLVVAADGRRSMLQRALHPAIGDPLTTSSRSWFGFKAHFPDHTGGLSRRVELFVFDGGYAGLGPVEGNRLDLALIARVDALNACGNSPQRLFDERMLANPLRGGAKTILLAVENDRPARFNASGARLARRDLLGDAQAPSTRSRRACQRLGGAGPRSR
jgi:2-polyprenyl-6-methoxyphenol hydroxylase-like FAD-dependent oxidoreductase